MTFKVGDKVVCIDPFPGANIKVGDVCVVVSSVKEPWDLGQFLRVRPPRFGREEGMYASRFKPYEEPEEPTDKDLADEYRRLMSEAGKIREKLGRRGYSGVFVGGVIKFRKMVTEEIRKMVTEEI